MEMTRQVEIITRTGYDKPVWAALMLTDAGDFASSPGKAHFSHEQDATCCHVMTCDATDREILILVAFLT
jgi:hypothetical protein